MEAKMIEFKDLKATISTDQSGRFPITSASGNAYILIMDDYDSNVILTTAIPSRKKEDILKGYSKCYQQLQDAGITPILQKIDNEVSELLI